MPNLVFIAV